MPELPEVETVRRGLARAMEGRRIDGVRVARRDLRRPLPADFEERLIGRTVTAVGRRAKYLTIGLDDGGVLLAHLGMSGRMIVDENGPDARPPHPLANHEHVTFVLGNRTLVRFADPRRFGMMDWVADGGLADHPLLAHLGPEPTGCGFRRGAAVGVAGRQAHPDQGGAASTSASSPASAISMSARACTSPGSRPGASPPMWGPRAPAAWPGRSGRPSSSAIEAGGSSLRDHAAPDGELGYFQHRFKVYGREGEPCPGCDCGGAVRRIVQSGRSTFYCAARQR